MRMFALLAASAALVAMTIPANARVHIVPKGQSCILGDDTLTGVTKYQCDILNEMRDGKIVQGCVVRGTYVAQLSEDQCSLIDGSWTWVRP